MKGNETIYIQALQCLCSWSLNQKTACVLFEGAEALSFLGHCQEGTEKAPSDPGSAYFRCELLQFQFIVCVPSS